ncbi:hypothetical protein Droror1_Dr00016501 [Drosera rotundifolia]
MLTLEGAGPTPNTSARLLPQPISLLPCLPQPAIAELPFSLLNSRHQRSSPKPPAIVVRHPSPSAIPISPASNPNSGEPVPTQSSLPRAGSISIDITLHHRTPITTARQNIVHVIMYLVNLDDGCSWVL